MKIKCDCGKFQASILDPSSSPGRLVCYCDDCQNYLNKLGKNNLLDSYGGTDIIPFYPSDIQIEKGIDQLCCNQLSDSGLSRWSTHCCGSPIVNTKAKFPWAGFMASSVVDQEGRFSKIKSRVMGKFSYGRPEFKISQKLSLKDALVVLPFILKGFLASKWKNAPLYNSDNVTPIVEPRKL